MANWRTDTNKKNYERYRHLNTNPLGYTWFGGTPSQLYAARKSLRKAIKKKDLKELGRGLHSLQDFYAHGQGFYSGRHLLFWTDPDHTYNDGRYYSARVATYLYLQTYISATNYQVRR